MSELEIIIATVDPEDCDEGYHLALYWRFDGRLHLECAICSTPIQGDL